MQPTQATQLPQPKHQCNQQNCLNQSTNTTNTTNRVASTNAKHQCNQQNCLNQSSNATNRAVSTKAQMQPTQPTEMPQPTQPRQQTQLPQQIQPKHQCNQQTDNWQVTIPSSSDPDCIPKGLKSSSAAELSSDCAATVSSLVLFSLQLGNPLSALL